MVCFSKFPCTAMLRPRIRKGGHFLCRDICGDVRDANGIDHTAQIECNFHCSSHLFLNLATLPVSSRLARNWLRHPVDRICQHQDLSASILDDRIQGCLVYQIRGTPRSTLLFSHRNQGMIKKSHTHRRMYICKSYRMHEFTGNKSRKQC